MLEVLFVISERKFKSCKISPLLTGAGDRNVICSPKINFSKSMLGLNILLENLSDASHRTSGFKMSDLRFTVYFRKGAAVRECKNFMEVPVSSTCATQRFMEGSKMIALL
jgi:hypothetical protein